MMNRKHNATNPYQGAEEKVLCLCSAGLLRSPTVAHVMWDMGYNTRAAGVDTDFALIPVDEVLIYWADKIVVMEAWQADEIRHKFGDKLEGKDIYVLGVVDSYSRNDSRLVELVKEKVSNLEEYKDVLLQEEPPAQTEEGEGQL